MSRPTIFEFVGGDPAFRKLASALHERCLADPELNHPFSHAMDPAHLEHLAAYLAEVFGGPSRYSESLGGHSGMLGIHAGQGAGEDYDIRFAACFMQAVDDAGFPDDPELRSTLRRYIDHASAEVVSYGPAGSVVAPGQPVPRWSWRGRAI